MINSGHEIGGVALSRTRRRTGFGVDTCCSCLPSEIRPPCEFCLLQYSTTVFSMDTILEVELDRRRRRLDVRP